jgi:hypothetical protein
MGPRCHEMARRAPPSPPRLPSSPPFPQYSPGRSAPVLYPMPVALRPPVARKAPKRPHGGPIAQSTTLKVAASAGYAPGWLYLSNAGRGERIRAPARVYKHFTVGGLHVVRARVPPGRPETQMTQRGRPETQMTQMYEMTQIRGGWRLGLGSRHSVAGCPETQMTQMYEMTQIRGGWRLGLGFQSSVAPGFQSSVAPGFQSSVAPGFQSSVAPGSQGCRGFKPPAPYLRHRRPLCVICVSGRPVFPDGPRLCFRVPCYR